MDNPCSLTKGNLIEFFKNLKQKLQTKKKISKSNFFESVLVLKKLEQDFLKKMLKNEGKKIRNETLLKCLKEAFTSK